jgi:recombination protein RecT
MQIIDWDKVYDLAKKHTKEDFIKATTQMGKVDELPAIQRFTTYMERYEKQVLPSLLQNSHTPLSPQKFVQIVINEVKKDSKLLNAFISNPASMFASILAGAEIGLVPSDLLGEFFLIPRNLKGDDGQYRQTVTPLIGYKGMVKILLRTGDIERIEAQVVYKGDKFSVEYGTTPKMVHKSKLDAERNAENITHAYAVAYYKSGKTQFQVMTRAEIMAIRDKAKYPNELYFNDKSNPNRWMEKKCALVQLSKLLDKDYYGTKAIELDARLEGGAYVTLENEEIKLIEGAAVKPARFRNIYGTLDKLPSND